MQFPLLPSRPAGRLLLAALVSLPATAATAIEPDEHGAAAGCAAQFEAAQRTDMESFRDYDATTFRAIHDPRAVTVFASGAVRYGIDSIMTALAPHFANREAVWSWTELYRVVDGCRAAYILYDATYEIPSIGYRQRTLTGVSYTRRGTRWLAVSDQSTYVNAPGP